MNNEGVPGKGKAKEPFNEKAPKTGHTSREFNRQANVKAGYFSNDIRRNTPNGPGFGPQGAQKKVNDRAWRYNAEQGKGRQARENAKDMIRLKDKFNDKSRGR